MQPVPLEIYRQLGSHRFLAMTGAKDLMGSADMLSMKLPATLTKERGNWFRITLTPDDLYTLEFKRVRLVQLQPMFTDIAKREGIYAECLREAFTEMTGLAVSL